MTPESVSAGGDQPLRAFIRDDRLITLPAKQGRRRAVLEHVAVNSFEAGAAYDEPAINDKLRRWCEGSDVDHVAIRRYLIDAGILTRQDGIYRWQSSPSAEERGR